MSNSLKGLIACALVMTFAVAATFGQSSHFDVTNMDPKTSACVDFYQYANGGWAGINPIRQHYRHGGVSRDSYREEPRCVA